MKPWLEYQVSQAHRELLSVIKLIVWECGISDLSDDTCVDGVEKTEGDREHDNGDGLVVLAAMCYQESVVANHAMCQSVLN